MGKKLDSKKCRMCGEIIENPTYSKELCDNCRAGQFDRAKAKRHPAPKDKLIPELVRLSIEAKAAGMTYGKYVGVYKL